MATLRTRKNTRKSPKSRKATRKQSGGKRSEWLQKVMRVYKEMKARNPDTRLADAMRAAKKQ